MQKKLNWQVYVNDDRHKAIAIIKDTINAHGGCILNFNMFSDLALNLSIEIPENSVNDLYDGLNSLGKVSNFDSETLNDMSTKECLIFLNISFAKGQGNLTIITPDVPG